MNDVFIASAYRTAIGNFGGALMEIPSYKLAGLIIREATQRAGLPITAVEDVIIGQALPAGAGQGAARRAAVIAGLPMSTSAFSVNNVCGSGLRAIQCGYALLLSGLCNIVFVGGMENMSLAPHLLNSVRFGKRIGEMTAVDSIIFDALTDPFENYHMGVTAENIARKYGISREEQDEYAVLSHNRAERAWKSGFYDKEVIPIQIMAKQGEYQSFSEDEHYRRNLKVSDICHLKPVFINNGTVTAANASGINDGAAGMILASREAVNNYSLKPVAKINRISTVGVDNKYMGMGGAYAIGKLVNDEKIDINQVDRFQINEAFAAQVLANIKYLRIPLEKINITGGAIALGHPIGASGARITVTLINELITSNLRYGIAAQCVGGGMGIAMLVETV